MVDTIRNTFVILYKSIEQLLPWTEVVLSINSFVDRWYYYTAATIFFGVNSYLLYKWTKDNLKQQKTQKRGFHFFFWAISLGRSVYLLAVFVTIQAILALLFFLIPLYFPSIRIMLYWVEIYIGLCGLIYSLSRQKSGRRGLYTAISHVFILNIGWLYGRWLGIAVFSIPLLIMLYYWLYRLALVVIPASNPDNKKEAFQRFKMLAWYLWGLQFPVWVINEHTDRTAEERITGDAFRGIGLPGMIWAQTHQTVGITSGTQFSRVDGPGVIYTHPYERPHEVVDLRPQIRTSLVEAMSQDGIPYKARVLAVFSIDKETWQDEEYNVLRGENKLLRGAKKPDRSAGNYHYSRSRVTAALSIESVKRFAIDTSDRRIIYWDDWVLSMVEEAARKELSRHSINDLWRPLNDELNLNPLDAIAASIKSSLLNQIRINGINLIAARVVDLQFDGGVAQKVMDQQIENWESYIEQDITKTRADAEAKQVKIKEEAAAYARSNLLATIARGLEQIGTDYENLPKKYVIAVRLIAALEASLREQPANQDKSEGDKKIEALHQLLKDITSSSDRRQK